MEYMLDVELVSNKMIIFFRMGYGWPTWEELEIGFGAISKALRG